MVILLGVLIIGLVLRSIGKSIDRAVQAASREVARTETTINYYDNRQYHVTEVHNGTRAETTNDRYADESAPWRL